MPVYDASLDHDLRIIHTRHEAGAVFMAEGWAQVSGRLGVALVTAAPGFANALGALYSARQSETPILFLSGDAPVAQDGRGAFQEFDQVAAATPFVKLSRRCMRSADLANDAAELIRLALSGRPGPVHLALPADVLTGDSGNTEVPRSDAFSPVSLPLAPQDLQQLAGLLSAAARPVMLTGPMLNPTRSAESLRALADALDAPVIPMESPRGLRDPALGAFAEPLREADLVIYLGKLLDFTTAFGAASALGHARVVVIDPEQDALARAERLLDDRLALSAEADAHSTVSALMEAARKPAAKRSAWCSTVEDAVKSRTMKAASAESGSGIGPQAICTALGTVLADKPDALLAMDGGEFGQWAQAYFSGYRRMINGTSGAIGGSICQAIGAKLAEPDIPVIVLLGDGTAGFYFAEFDTAVRVGAPIIAVIGNDARWNAEHLIQLNSFGPDRLIGCELNAGARYDLAAAALGCHGDYVTEDAKLGPAFERALASGKPACVNIAMEGLPAPIFSRNNKPEATH